MKNYILLSAFIFSFLPRAFAAGGDTDFEQTDEATHIPAMIQVTDADVGETIADLEGMGITVLRHRGNILLTYIPMDAADNLRRARSGISVEYSRPRYHTPTMNLARSFGDAHLINEGFNLPQPYTGKGVVVGVCDNGFDARHPNFLTSDGSECRVRRVTQYRELYGGRDVYSTPQEIYDWETDSNDLWHATHVTGIAAGGYKENNLQSLAPDAEIVFSDSMLSDVGLLAGVEDIIEYAKEVGKPAVVNLSMGNYSGPHDGSSLFTQYLDLCADDAIICLSAGNEGNTGEVKSMSFDFSESASEVKFLPNDWGGTDFSGAVEVWSKDSTPFTLTLYWHHDYQTADNIFPYESITFPAEGQFELRMSVDPDDPDYDEAMAEIYYEGYLIIRGGISPLNGRFMAEMEMELKSEVLRPGTAWALYWPGLMVEADPGAHIDIFPAGGIFLRGERGYPSPDNKMNISALATGHRTISVGMMNNTRYYDVEGGEGSGYAPGDVNIHSSYGTLIDGRVMPLTVAPGALVNSSCSSAYLRKHPDDIQYMDAEADFDGGKAYWVATDGTSMSCPFVAGAIATWLQAYPRLTPEEAISVIQATNRTSGYPDPDNPRHGQGWFNAYSGLQQVLDIAALSVGTVDAPDFTLRFDGTSLLVGNPSGEAVTLEVFSPSGILLGSVRIADTLVSVPLHQVVSGISRGLYLVRAATASRAATLKLPL